jgi:hypothetical protein
MNQILRRFSILLPAAATLVAGAFVAVPAMAQKPVLAMLDQLMTGRWELRIRDEAGRSEQFCLQDARRFIQLRHPGRTCEQLIVADEPNEVTVQYTCKGQGYGRTSIRRESASLIQIDSQGISGGLPFAFSAEARRVGQCAP